MSVRGSTSELFIRLQMKQSDPGEGVGGGGGDQERRRKEKDSWPHVNECTFPPICSGIHPFYDLGWSAFGGCSDKVCFIVTKMKVDALPVSQKLLTHTYVIIFYL